MKTIIQTPTPNMDESCAFYAKLGFDSVEVNERTFVFSKGVTIEINTDRYSRAGIKFFGEDWKAFLTENDLTNKATKTKNGFLITSPSGCCVYLESIIEHLPKNEVKPLIGEYGGLSLETNQIQESVEFWNFFGFKQTMGDLNQGWIVLKNEEGFSLSLMKHNCCPHLFFNPSLSYFNGKQNTSIIEKIRSQNIPITEEITYFDPGAPADNIIIRDPGGLGFFIFND